MEKSVTLRFYEVRRTSANRPMFADILRMISRKQMTDREKRVGLDEILVRLEDFDEAGSEIWGQFIRGQSGNRPGRMLPAGTDALPFREPLGHGVAFRYRTQDGILAIQFDSKILSPARVVDYLYAHDPNAEFQLLPRMRADAWQKFNDLPLRKLTVAIAGHPNPAQLDNDTNAVWANVNDMKDAYGAETVRIELGMGHCHGALRAAAKAFAREAFRRWENGEDDIRTLKGVMDTGQGVPNDEIDLMGALLDVKEVLSFQEDDWRRFYDLRRELLSSRLRLL